jgi:type I restriction enzyme S subunit
MNSSLTSIRLYNIPADWVGKDISDLCLLQRGFDITEATRQDGNVPVYSSSGLSYFHNVAIVSPPGVVTGRKGILGKVFFINEPFWAHDTTLWVKDFKGNDPKFVYYFLNAFHLERFDAATSVPTLNRNNLKNIPILLPPLPEQQAIAAALSDMDALLISLDALIAKKCLIKQGAMQELLTGKKRLPGFSGEWEEKKLGDIGFTYGGMSGKTKSDFEDGVYPYIPFLNILNNPVIDTNYFDYVNISPTERQNKAQKNDLFFNGSSETPEEVGMCSVLLEDIPDLYLNSFCFGFRQHENSNANSLFLTYFFRSNVGRKLIYFLAQGATRYNLSKANFLKLLIPCPSPSEQTAIAEILSDMDSEINALESRREKTRLLKVGMMQELLTGRIRLV